MQLFLYYKVVFNMTKGVSGGNDKALHISKIVQSFEVRWKGVPNESVVDREEFTKCDCSSLNSERIDDMFSRIMLWFEI